MPQPPHVHGNGLRRPERRTERDRREDGEQHGKEQIEMHERIQAHATERARRRIAETVGGPRMRRLVHRQGRHDDQEAGRDHHPGFRLRHSDRLIAFSVMDPRVARAREVLTAEAKAIDQLVARVGDNFLRVVEAVIACRGHVIVTGMGKAGKIAEKLSATLASTGTPSIFLHPAEAVHGDLGRCLKGDVVLVLSHSGETDEIVRLLPAVKQIGAKLVAIAGAPKSTLAREADLVVDLGRIEEACPLGLAPTASTTVMLALGDALAMVVLESRGFTKDDFALFHPAGALGRKLLRVSERMRTGDALPLVRSGTRARDALAPMGAKGRAGAALVVDAQQRLLGIFTDGDLRRLLTQQGAAFLDGPIDAVMTKSPKTIGPDVLAAEASRILRELAIDQLPVVDESSRAIGLLDVQDLLGVPLG